MITEEKKRSNGGRFAKGASGNPAGRPPGSRNRAGLLLEGLLSGKAEEMTHKIIERAMDGNATAMRLCMERLLPPCQDRPIHLPLQCVETPEQIASGLSNIVEAVGDGQITPQEGETVARILEMQMRVVSTVDLDRRLERVEQAVSSLQEAKSGHGPGNLVQLLRDRPTDSVGEP